MSVSDAMMKEINAYVRLAGVTRQRCDVKFQKEMGFGSEVLDDYVNCV